MIDLTMDDGILPVYGDIYICVYIYKLYKVSIITYIHYKPNFLLISFSPVFVTTFILL